jgi:hypothetical protein
MVHTQKPTAQYCIHSASATILNFFCRVRCVLYAADGTGGLAIATCGTTAIASVRIPASAALI